jgi:hypothetical protein
VAERRALWFFPVAYLVERLVHYAPVLRLASGVGRTRLGARLGRLVIPLNLLDSSVYFLEGSSAPSRSRRSAG